MLDKLLAAYAEARAGCARGLHHITEVQYDEYDGNNDQDMDPTPGAREAWTYVPTEKAEQPQYYENYDDSPQNEISPFDRSNDLLEATWSVNQVAVDLTV